MKTNSYSANLKAAYDYLYATWEKEQAFRPYLYDVAKGTRTRLNLFEVFTAAVILEVLGFSKLDPNIKKSLINFIRSSTNHQDGLFSFFYKNRKAIPPDVDTTALCACVLTKHKAMDQKEGMLAVNAILDLTSNEGKMELFFTREKSWLGTEDHVISANALYLIYLYGQESRAKAIEDHLYSVLESNEFLNGSLYYFSPDTFLLMLTRLLCDFPALRPKFEDCLKEKLFSRIGSTEAPLDLSMRIIASKALQLSNEREIQTLISIQLSDGSWGEDFLYAAGPHLPEWQMKFEGSQELTIAFAIRALE